MIVSFRDVGTEDVFNGRSSKQARKRCPVSLWPVAARKLEYLDSADAVGDLRAPPGNRLEALAGDRAGQYSIRSTSSTGSAFDGRRREPRTLRSSTTTR